MGRLLGNQIRHDARDDGKGHWSVYDIFTGLTAQLNGAPLDGLQIEEADDAVELLNAEFVAMRLGTTH